MISSWLLSSTGSMLCGATSRPGLAQADSPSVRHCPKCQVSGDGGEGLARRSEAERPPFPIITWCSPLQASIADIAYQKKAAIYDILFNTSAERLFMIAADPKCLVVRIGVTSIPHTCGSALTQHPYVHLIASGGGPSLDGQRWISCRLGFFSADARAVETALPSLP
jgi:hypothetical protein